jgi:T5SS/PEP-CTERM-associated repeat protein
MRNHTFAIFLRTNLAALALLAGTTSLRADIGTLGDVTPTIDQFGYPSGGSAGDIIVGNTGTGGLSMDVALQPDALRSDTGIIGNQAFSIGRATFTGIPSDWKVGTTLTVGNNGQGFLDLFNSAMVQVGDSDDETVTNILNGFGLLTVGALESGQGVVTINGVGSRVIVADMIVGDLGVGDVQVTARGALITGAAIVGNQSGGIGTVALTDLGSKWTVGSAALPGQLIVGSPIPGAVSSTGTVRIANQSLVEVSDSITISQTGTIELQSGGTLRILPSSVAATSILNAGTIMGDGFINFSSNPLSQAAAIPHQFVITGEFRNQANAIEGGGTTQYGANQREKLVITGNISAGDEVINESTIESYGGEMEFQVPVVNNFEIVARDAIMRFPDGLSNEAGSFMVLGGETTIHGPITTDVLADIFILNDSIVTVHGDFIFTESFLVAALTDVQTSPFTSTLSMVVGDNASVLNVLGNVELGNVSLSLDFVGSAPVIGQTFELMTAAGDTDGLGEFANDQVVVDGKLWNIGYDADSVYVTYSGLSAGLAGDFDNDGDVDGRDFLAWQRNPSLGNLADWQANYGQNGAIVPAVTAVPEPASAMLMLAGAIGLAFRRK